MACSPSATSCKKPTLVPEFCINFFTHSHQCLSRFLHLTFKGTCVHNLLISATVWIRLVTLPLRCHVESPSQQAIRYWSQPHLQRPSLIRPTIAKDAQSPYHNHPRRQPVPLPCSFPSLEDRMSRATCAIISLHERKISSGSMS